MILDRSASVLALVRAPAYVPRRSDKNLIVLHRLSLAGIGVSDGALDWSEVAAAYRPRGSLTYVTGGRCPYHYLVRVGGEVEQLLPPLAVGAHASGMNRCSIGIAVVGEHRPAGDDQVAALVALVRDLAASLDLDAATPAWLVGHCSPEHDELHGPPSLAWPQKRCPEPVVSVAEVRALVAGGPDAHR